MTDEDNKTENDPRAADLNAAYRDGWNDAIKQAAKVAENPSNISMVGGSTGDALGTAKRIAAAIRALHDGEAV